MLSLWSPALSRVARYSAVITLAALAACANDAPSSRLLAPASPSLGKTGGGSTQRILFSSNIDAINGSYTLDVYSMNPDGTGITRLTNSPAFDGEARWSPDGKRIAFASNRDKAGSDIYVMNADGSHVTRLTSDPGFFESPTWSKDGKQIAFVSTDGPRIECARAVLCSPGTVQGETCPLLSRNGASASGDQHTTDYSH